MSDERVASLEGQVQELRREIGERDSLIGRLNDENNEKEEKIEAMSEVLNELSGALNGWRDDVDEGSTDDIRQAKEALEEAVDSHKKSLAAVESDMEKLEKKVDELI